MTQRGCACTAPVPRDAALERLVEAAALVEPAAFPPAGRSAAPPRRSSRRRSRLLPPLSCSDVLTRLRRTFRAHWERAIEAVPVDAVPIDAIEPSTRTSQTRRRFNAVVGQRRQHFVRALPPDAAIRAGLTGRSGTLCVLGRRFPAAPCFDSEYDSDGSDAPAVRRSARLRPATSPTSSTWTVAEDAPERAGKETAWDS